MDGAVVFFRLAVHGGLGEVAVGQRTSFDRGEGGVLLAHVVQRVFDFFILYDDLRMVGAQLFVALDHDLGHDLEAGLEAQRLAVMNVQVGDLGLRHRNQAELFGFFAEVARDQGLDHVAFQIFFEALLDDGRGHVAGAEAGQARDFLILLDDRFRFASDFLGGDFDRDLALDAVLSSRRSWRRLFLWDSLLPFGLPGVCLVRSRPDPKVLEPGPIYSHAVNLECKD